jgi:putative tryptophan/tyrosine transport system substrate-binding protein
MKRREFIGLAGGAAAWPVVARAQKSAMPTIGVLSILSSGDSQSIMTAFRDGLRESGYIEGKNVAIEYRWAAGRSELLQTMATELVSRPVDVILASGGTGAALAASSATKTIPIVFNVGSDPVKAGLVSSLNRPGGNVTGVTWLSIALTGKRFDLLHQVKSASTRIAFLDDSTNPNMSNNLEAAQTAAHSLGLTLNVLNVRDGREIDAVFPVLDEQRVDALVISATPLFINQKDQLVALAARHSIAVIYPLREFTVEGGLMSYSPNYNEVHRQCGSYVARILRGETPMDLPVQQSTKLEFVINLKTAKTLGLTIPPTLLAIADEVIE